MFFPRYTFYFGCEHGPLGCDECDRKDRRWFWSMIALWVACFPLTWLAIFLIILKWGI